MAWIWIAGTLFIPLLLYLYINLNDRRLTHIPPSAFQVSPARCTPEDVHETAARLRENPPSITDQIPPKTDRRYIVVGGAGFLGGWIVIQLLERGEDPKRIRVVDIRAPVRHDLTTGPAKDVHFIQADVSDAAAVAAAFSAPWPDDVPAGEAAPEISVFHTAANIRFYEKSKALLANSAKVNVGGTQNVLDAARSIGATALVYTSSASVSVKRTRFLLWPWESEPRRFVQAINEDEAFIPREHDEFFSNYAVTKMDAERRVRAADRTASGGGVLRTGCLRPGNGIFGPGGDVLAGAYLVRRVNPSWIGTSVQNFTYVENAAVAHLLYEQRLVALMHGDKNPDIGGQAFIIADPGPPPTYNDVYVALSTLDRDTVFPEMSPTLMLLIAHLLEWYYLARFKLIAAGVPLAQWVPPIGGDLVNLQPSLFNLVSVHLVFDDSRARLPAAQGGLGYKGAWTTLEALHKTAAEHKLGLLRSSQRAAVAGIPMMGFGLFKAQKGVAKAGATVAQKTGVNPVQVLSK